jgi:hypothetical protein
LLIDKIIRDKKGEENKFGGKSDIEGLGKSEFVDNMANENPGNVGSNVTYESPPCSHIIPRNGGMAA